jgi:tetratricopeptide (TPR) repeat protein
LLTVIVMDVACSFAEWRRLRLTARLCSLAILILLLLLMAARPCRAGRQDRRQRYLAAVRLSLSDEPLQAIEELTEIHARDWQIAEIRRNANWLAEADPEVLVPLIALEVNLHTHAIGLHSDDHIASKLIGRSEIIIELLVKLGSDYLERADHVEAAPIVSRLLTCTAIHYRDHRYRHREKLENALSLLELALKVNPENTVARHIQGCIEEKRGRYGRAARSFQRLLELIPKNQEVRLRLALCLLRDGRVEPAEALLGEVARGDGPAWVRSLAWQELAQLQTARGDRQEALAVVRRGIAQLGEDRWLQLLLLFLLDDRSTESSTLLARLSDGRDRRWQASPRVRYGEPPAEFTLMLEQLRQDIMDRLPRLEQALGRVEAGREPAE